MLYTRMTRSTLLLLGISIFSVHLAWANPLPRIVNGDDAPAGEYLSLLTCKQPTC